MRLISNDIELSILELFVNYDVGGSFERNYELVDQSDYLKWFFEPSLINFVKFFSKQ